MIQSIFGLGLPEVHRMLEIQDIALYLLCILKAVNTQYNFREYMHITPEASANNHCMLKTQTGPIVLPSCHRQQQQCTADVLERVFPPGVKLRRRRFCYRFSLPASQCKQLSLSFHTIAQGFWGRTRLGTQHAYCVCCMHLEKVVNEAQEASQTLKILAIL